MLNRFTTIFLFSCNFCFAQSKIEYANFIQTDTSVKWAAVYSSYVNLTPLNPNFNIRNFYVSKLKKDGATAYLQDNSSFSVTPVKLNYDQYKAGIKAVKFDHTRVNWFVNYDEKNNATEKIFTQEAGTCDTCTTGNRLSFFKVKQLLYYRNNRLQIQNILMTPVIYKKEAGTSKEAAAYFETSDFAFNEIKNADISMPASATFIGRSCNNLVLFPPDSNSTSETNILTLNDWNLARLLYAGVKKNILQAYSTDKSIYPDKRNLLNYRKIDEYKAEEVLVPAFDSLGNITEYRKLRRDINYDSIYNYTLIQDFFFDFKTELLYSKLVAFAPRIGVYTSTGLFLGLTDYWGVIFPPEKKDIVKKKK